MQFIAAAAAIAFAAGASAQSGSAQPSGGLANPNQGAGTDFQATAYDTVVVNAYVTTCPGNIPTTSFAYNGVTYSATANQVVTVTNCPCTVTAPAGTIPSGATIATAPNVTPAPTAPATNGNNAGAGSGADTGAGSGADTGAGSGADTGAGSGATNGTTSPNTPEQFTGAASKVSGLGLAAVFALAAYAL